MIHLLDDYHPQYKGSIIPQLIINQQGFWKLLSLLSFVHFLRWDTFQIFLAVSQHMMCSPPLTTEDGHPSILSVGEVTHPRILCNVSRGDSFHIHPKIATQTKCPCVLLLTSYIPYHINQSIFDPFCWFKSSSFWQKFCAIHVGCCPKSHSFCPWKSNVVHFIRAFAGFHGFPLFLHQKQDKPTNPNARKAPLWNKFYFNSLVQSLDQILGA